MGGWISLLLASGSLGDKVVKDKITGLVLICPAFNFIKHYYQHARAGLSGEKLRALDDGALVVVKTPEGSEYPVWKAFTECEDVELDLPGGVGVDCPVRIMHGVEDDRAPFLRSVDIMKAVASRDVEVLFRKNAQHQFLEPESLRILGETVDKIIDQTKN